MRLSKVKMAIPYVYAVPLLDTALREEVLNSRCTFNLGLTEASLYTESWEQAQRKAEAKRENNLTEYIEDQIKSN